MIENETHNEGFSDLVLNRNPINDRARDEKLSNT